MPSWSIRIVTKNGVTSFDPPNLDAMQDDVVSWNNTTNDKHQPWQLTGPVQPGQKPDPVPDTGRFKPTYMSDPIESGDPSRPGYNVTLPKLPTPPPANPAPVTIYYYCKTHPERASERGSITGHYPGTGVTS